MRATLAALCLLGGACLLAPPASSRAEEKRKGDKGAKGLASPFVYPKAKGLTTAASPEREGPGIYHAKHTTPDSPAKVVAWYKKQIKFAGAEGVGFARGQEAGEARSVQDDSRRPGKTDREQGEPRSVTLWALVKKTKDCYVTAVVSRTKDEKLTHIALTYVAADKK